MPKKKVKKYRGSRTCGGGSHKKRRGAGHRGGRGNAGAFKHKYLRTIKLVKAGLYQIGKRGFTRPACIVRENVLARMLFNRLKELKEEGILDENLYRFFKSRVDLNVGELCQVIEKLAEIGIAEKKGDLYRIDLSKIGYARLLGSGNVNKKMHVIVEYATPKAIEKIEAAGGTVETS
uniref:Large ribosomal subunit protein uL15 n=1 Tax=Geoglobus ahangari TaxID=113653 RepID=A0A7C3YP19_9EURY